MTIGTRSLLFGAHCWLIHPWFVALGWFKLYGFPYDPRLWLAFIIHDWGYAGCSSMDGADGEQHPRWAAEVMWRLFGGKAGRNYAPGGDTWWTFMIGHSRFLAKRENVLPSMLCWADKLAFALQPAWMYLPLVRLTGELDEYMADAATRYGTARPDDRRHWHRTAQARMAREAYEGALTHYRLLDDELNPRPPVINEPASVPWVTFWQGQADPDNNVVRCVCGRLTTIRELIHWQHPTCPDCGHDWRPASAVNV